MENIIVQLSRYVITILFAIYTFYCFRAFAGKSEERKNRIFRGQRVITLMIHAVCYSILLMEYNSIKVIFLYVLQLSAYLAFIKLYETFYKGLSKLVLNNMLMAIMIGFIMLGRLSYDDAFRQFLMACAAMGICLFVPMLIHKLTFLDRLGIHFALAGILLLMLVFVIGVEKNGSRNWIALGGIQLQPSEFVKIIFVFCVAALLSKEKSFKHIVIITVLAAIHVVILVVEKDLGAALIYFFTYIMMLYIATNNIVYLGGGFLGGSIAAIAAYQIFSHVQVRVAAWRDPWSSIQTKGYQVAQSLFAIGTGGFIGMGLGKGLPRSVPVVESDFVFAAISEELGALFAICLILIYLSCFIMFINIAMKMKKEFYKYTAFGLGVVFLFQVFLSVGGVTKFIPSTGVTLPLVSYGGSSVMSTIILFSIIQGMYVLNGKEEALDEGEQERIGKKARKAKKAKKN